MLKNRACSAVLLTASLFGIGCDRGDPLSCGYWTERLPTTHKEQLAIEKLGKLKCSTEAKALVAFYDKALYRAEIVKTLEGFGNIDPKVRPDVVPVIRKALRDREGSPIAAQLIKNWQLKETKDDVDEIIRSNANPAARENLVNTLLAFLKPDEIVKTLVFVVGEDPTTQGVQVNQLAADKLSQVNWTKVEPALKKEAIDRLIMGLFMKDANNGTSYQAAREALGHIGPEAGPALVLALNGKHELLNRTAETYGIPRWQHRDGPELVEVLWDVGDPNSAEAVINSVARAGNRMPPEVAMLKNDQQSKWNEVNSNRMVMSQFILAYLKNDVVIPKAKDILLRPKPWVTQFLFTANALALMGTPASTTALFDVFDVMGTQKNTDSQATLVTAMTLGLTPALLPRYEASVYALPVPANPEDRFAADKKATLEEKAQEALPLAYYTTVKECGSDPNCYITRLSADKGKLGEVRKLVDEASSGVEKARIALGEKVKPLVKEFQELGKKLDEFQVILDKFKESKIKAEKDQYNATVDLYNPTVDRMKAIREERSKLAEETMKAPNDALKAIQLRYYGIEKAVIALSSLDGVDHDKVFPLVVELFKEASPVSYLQFRQWAFVYLERFATPARKALLEDLYRSEKISPMAQYFALRLHHLLARIDRVPAGAQPAEAPPAAPTPAPAAPAPAAPAAP